MQTDIFIRTYGKDLEWLKYCLRSVAKYCSGFRQIVIVIPKKDFPLISHLTNEKVLTENSIKCMQCKKIFEVRNNPLIMPDLEIEWATPSLRT
jgi:hypothetical protein